MKFNDACEKFSSDVDWLAGRWRNIKIAFECDAYCTLSGDVDLERAYRRVCELKEKIEGIRAARIEKCRCVQCGNNRADYPSRLCPGCEAYMEHCT